MSKFSSVGPFQEKATWLPSGENDGLLSIPGYVVSGTTFNDVVSSGWCEAGLQYHSRKRDAARAAAATPAAPLLHAIRRESIREGGSDSSAAGFKAVSSSSSSDRASPRSRRRRVTSFSRQRANSR